MCRDQSVPKIHRWSCDVANFARCSLNFQNPRIHELYLYVHGRSLLSSWCFCSSIIVVILRQVLVSSVNLKQPPYVFYIKDFIKNFILFAGKQLCWNVFNKVAGLQACSFIKKILKHRWFLVNIAKFLRTSMLRNIRERLLLNNLRK